MLNDFTTQKHSKQYPLNKVSDKIQTVFYVFIVMNRHTIKHSKKGQSFILGLPLFL